MAHSVISQTYFFRAEKSSEEIILVHHRSIELRTDTLLYMTNENKYTFERIL